LTVEPAVRVLWFFFRRDWTSLRESFLAARRLWTGAGALLRGDEAPGTRPALVQRGAG
jgi:hypothetical protein